MFLPVHKLGCSCALVTASLLLSPVDVSLAQVAAQSGTIVIHAGRLLDRPGTAARGATTIVIRDGKIAELRDGFVAAPADADAVDLKDEFVLPGLIDAHVHLGSNDDQGVVLNTSVESEPLAAYMALWNAQKTLQAGFTTVRNIGDYAGSTLALRDAISRGWVTGPRIVDGGRPIATTLGHGDRRVGIPREMWSSVSTENICDGADECRKAVRREIGRGAEVIKIVTTGLSSREIGPDRGAQMSPEEAKAIVETAHQYGLKVAAHAHGGYGLTVALQAGADSIEHGTLMSDADVALLKKSDAYYVPTLFTVSNYQRRMESGLLSPEGRAMTQRRIDLTGKSLEKAVRAGVKIAFGTDAGFTQHGQNAGEFALLVKHGLTPMQAIAAATVNAAELLGVAGEVGSLEPGKSADIVAVRGDPLKDISVLQSIRFVMREGVVYKTE